MRWERLFEDIEARLEAEEHAAAEGEVIDLTRAERSQLALRDRLRAHKGLTLRWSVVAGAIFDAGLIDVGIDWVLLRAMREEMLVPVGALRFVEGLSRSAVGDDSQLARRWHFGMVVRGLARDRAAVSLRMCDGDLFSGTVDRVGTDHLDLAVHPVDQPRRGSAVRLVRCVPLGALAGVVIL